MILSSKAERRLLWTLACIQFLAIADFMVLSPLGPVLMRTFEVGPSELGWLVSTYSLSAATVGLLAALFVDRFDRRSVVLTAFGMFLLGLAACALAPTYGLLLASRVICGASGGLLGAMVYTVVADAIPFERRGAATGVIATAFSLSSVMGLPIGLLFASAFGWHAPYYFLLIVGLGVFVAVWRFVPSMTAHLVPAAVIQGQASVLPLKTHRAAWMSLRDVLRDRNHLKAYFFSFLVWSSSFIVIPFLSVYNVMNVGIAESELPILYLVGGLATLVTSRLVGRLTDRLGPKRAYLWVALLAVPMLLIVTQMPAAPLWVVLITSTLFFVIVPARTIPTMGILAAASQPALRGTFMSLHTTVQSLTTSVAALLGGLIITRSATGKIEHYDLLGYIAVILTVLAMAWVRGVRTKLQAPTKSVSTPVKP